MAPKSPISLVFGTGNVGNKSLDSIVRYDTPEEVNAVLNTFYERGYRELDTSRGYSPHAPGNSEPRLGAADAGSRFEIGTKIMSREPGSHSREMVEKSMNESLAALKVEKVDILYLHHPDRSIPFEDVAATMDKAYREGKFKRFGLSNYTAKEVEQFIQLSETHGYVKPSVYQGQYNAVARGCEKDLLPLLRKHGIAFYSWSPAAAGFFAGNHKNASKGGRYDTSHFLGKFYASRYCKPSIEAAVDRVREAAEKHGLNGHAAALRWTAYHSALSAEHGDAIIIGASSPQQLAENIDMLEAGPLPQEVLDAVNDIAKEIEGDEIAYHD